MNVDCTEFRSRHCAFIDDTLAGIELVRMQRHISECAECADHDTRVRRALLLFRNVPHIEPSGDFTTRLEARLRELGPCDRLPQTGPSGGFRAVALIGAVASFAMLGYIAGTLPRGVSSRGDLVLPPVIAMADRAPSAPASPQAAGHDELSSAATAVVASVSAGMPIWPAALLAEQGPIRFAGTSSADLASYSGR